MTFTVNLRPLIGDSMIASLCARAERTMQTPADEIIADDYLRRWHRFKHPAASHYLHLYVGNDPAPWYHDHPWPSLSLCVRGFLIERGIDSRGHAHRLEIVPGTLAYRAPSYSHTLELVSRFAVTLFFTGPHVREWGWHLPDGWRPWHEISRLHPDGVTRIHDPQQEPEPPR